MTNKYKYIHMFNKNKELESAVPYEVEKFNFNKIVEQIKLYYPKVYWINIDRESSEPINLIKIK